MNKPINLARPFFDKDEINEIQKVLDSGWVSSGPKVKEFEAAVSQYIGVNYAVAVTNCTCALHLANLSIGLTKKDEVIVADYTFPATGHSVLYCGARPVFVDIDPKTYNIDPEKIEANITPKTKAIIPVHTFGQCADMGPIMEIAEKHDLFVIEDAACALGSKYNKQYAGSIGDVGCFSFHARKGITTGEGGMVVTNNKKIAEKIRYLAVFGMKTAWERERTTSFMIPHFYDVGYNYKMSDISAAVGVAQMKKINRIIRKKRAIAQHWDAVLDEMSLISKPYSSPFCKHIYQAYVALVDKHIDRNSVIEKMAKSGVQTQIGTYASHIQSVYHSRKKCPVSDYVYRRAIALPLYYSLCEDEIKEVSDVLSRALRGML